MGPRARILVAALLVAVALVGVVLVSSALAEIAAVKRVAASFSGNDLVLVTNRTNKPIVTADRMLPYQKVRGTVRLANRGRDPGVLWVKPRRQSDIESIYGGRLSKRLILRIVRLTYPRGTVWQGYVRSLGRGVKLGILKPGQVARYRFVVQFRPRPPLRVPQGASFYMKGTYKTDWVFTLRPKR